MYGSSQNSFNDLMYMAKQNADEAKKKASKGGLFPDAGRPRKADPKDVKLKQGVQKFLQKQAEEERRKKEEEKLKKEKLLQLRQQDRKATNRVRKMLSMTKSANKSCVDDAKDCLNESVSAQGEFQPDEDDYGYTSNYADMMHKKMMEKYKAIPVKPAFPQQSSVPVPRHQTLKNGTSWRRKEGNHHDYEEERGYSSPEPEREEPVSRKPDRPSKPHRPPPPDYHLLLQMAQQKQFEPAVPLKPVVEKKSEEEHFEFGRPMTAKEKKAYLAEKEMKERLARRMEGKSDKNNNSSANGSSSSDNKPGKMPSFKIPRARSATDDAPAAPPPKKPRPAEPEPSSSKSSRDVPKPSMKYRELTERREPERIHTSAKSYPMSNGKSSPISNGRSNGISNAKPNGMSNGKPNGIKPSSSMNGASSRSLEKPQKQTCSSSLPVSKTKSDSYREKPVQSKPDQRERERERMMQEKRIQEKMQERMQERMQIVKEKPRYLSAFDGGKEKERERDRKQPLHSNDSNKPRPGSSRDMHSSARDDSRDKMRAGMGSKMDDRNRSAKAHERDRHDDRPVRREMSPPPRRSMPMKPRMRDEPPPRMRPPSQKPSYRGRAVIDSDEEYDSEMDDFIDDSEADMSTISAEISKIFNYDKRRYAFEDSDDECMESSVHQQMMEERRSLRIGIQEDMEDMAREEEEKRRMKMKMKKMKR